MITLHTSIVVMYGQIHLGAHALTHRHFPDLAPNQNVVLWDPFEPDLQKELGAAELE